MPTFKDVSILGGKVKLEFYVVTKSWWTGLDRDKNDDLFLICSIVSDTDHSLLYRSKRMKVYGTFVFNFKISLATGKALYLEEYELKHRTPINYWMLECDLSIAPNNSFETNNCTQANRDLFKAEFIKMFEFYNLSQIMKEARQEHIAYNKATAQEDLDKLLKQAEELKAKIRSYDNYSFITGETLTK